LRLQGGPGAGRLAARRRRARRARRIEVDVPDPPPLLATDFPTLTLHRRGKVRDVYDLGEHLVIVATDRISAFDHVLPTGIPDKGRVLTQISAFWFERLAPLVEHHLVTTDVDAFPAATRPYREVMRGRSMLVRRADPVPIECVVRGYLAGSAWKDYQRTGTICGIALPPGLVESAALPDPIFTPATKAESGHDENITEVDAARRVGAGLVERLKTLSLALYRAGAAHAEACGIIVADTKFEFGLTPAGTPLLIDEALTPDSSRFWPRDGYRPGGPQPSFDKQYVRDYLERIAWDKRPPAPPLPADVVAETRRKYLEAFERLTGRTLV
jgi:phosphoribosylaminoimidazole-succinocarboxamide synthase